MLKHIIHFIYRSLFYKDRIIGILKTKMMLIYNGVNYQDYRCYGVPCISVDKGNTMSIGSHFSMNNGMSANRLGYNTPCVFRCGMGNIIIGDNVGMSQTVLIASGADITIGNNVKLGSGVKVYTSNFHSLYYKERRDWEIDKLHRDSSHIVIEDDCFIGAGSIILKGVTIGARSIVGAGSVVTKSIPSDEIWAGNPAKFIRKL